jgi:hypothetical protein
LVLLDVLAAVRPEKFPRRFGILCVESYGVEFMVSYDDVRFALVHHLANNDGRFNVGRPPIDEIADKNGLTGGVAIGATRFSVAHFFE